MGSIIVAFLLEGGPWLGLIYMAAQYGPTGPVLVMTAVWSAVYIALLVAGQELSK